jgi:TonB family protein
LNELLSELKGEKGDSDIQEYKSLKEACNSGYIVCEKNKKIIGLNLQFANLNGIIPEMLSQLKDLMYVNFDYNYLKGSIPVGLYHLKNLKSLRLTGNFLEGPVPEDLLKFSSNTKIDLSQNSIKTDDKKLINRLNIRSQFNLEGCRSPDSIFVDMPTDTSLLNAVKLQNIDSTSTYTEVMPRFPGCEEEDLSVQEKQQCATERMLQFIYRNLRYPSYARENGVEGMAVVQFVILKNGDIGFASLLKDPGGRCGNAALWIVNRMNFICDKWIPGEQGGNKVKVLFTLPVRFKLE